MSRYQITNQRDLRRAFWEMSENLGFPLSRKRNRLGEYCTDTRVAFVNYVDSLCRDGIISEALADRATL